MKDEINLPKEIKEAFTCIDYELSVCNDELPKILDYITNLQEENERLNNVINELEKWLKEDKEYAMNNFECGRCFNMFDIINKLKELKEGDKDE